MTFKNPSYIVNMKAFDENNKPLEVEKIIMNEDTVFKTQLKLGKNRLNFIYKLPVEKSSE